MALVVITVCLMSRRRVLEKSESQSMVGVSVATFQPKINLALPSKDFLCDDVCLHFL